MTASASAVADSADITIIGGGVAGLAFALSVDRRYRVALLSKRTLGNSASAWAQGGVAAVLQDNDTFANHIQDTLTAGDGLCDESIVRAVIESAPEAIRWLAQQGVNFNTDNDDNWALTLEGGHSERRIVHVDDRSGAAIVEALISRLAEHDNITVYENHVAVDISTDNGECRGVYALDLHNQQVRAITSGAVVLASGGAGRVYLYSSTPDDATGDGVGIAYRAGCRIRNMEFFQFHPTCLYHPQASTLLISEAVRGEGGRLVNGNGKPFTQNTHADGDLAPRDIVARAIDAEMKKTGADCVYLDCTTHDENFWRKRFPTIFSRCAEIGIRLSADYIPVVPAAHYSCGGIATTLCGQTDLPYLYAIGETADSGLHGANRLASNSLLECVVMARQCAEMITTQTPQRAIPAWDERRISPPTEAITIAHNWEELRRIMWNYVGIVRSDQRLQRARRRVEWIRDEIDEYYRRHIVSRDFLELRNLTQCAALIIEGALSRRESRGLHYTVDCPQKKATTVATNLCRADFDNRRLAINSHCPFSQRLIVANCLTRYRDHFVGFCNAGCRDAFADAVCDNFNHATATVLRAREDFNQLINV